MALAPVAAELRDAHVIVRPSRPDDAPGLFAALDDQSVWTWLSVARPRDVDEVRARLEASEVARAAGTQFQWTVLLADGETVVGTSSYGDIEPAHGRLEIGWTSYGVPWQRSAVNTATKLLLLGHAFDDLGYERVALKTDGRNERSQAAIARLGAVREGVLRSHVVRPDGTRRDTVYFSILRDEWPAVRDRLRARLARR